MNNTNWKKLATNEMNIKTKPLGALGDLEELAVQIAMIQKTLNPVIYPACVLVFGADHGIARQGVSAYPSEVTAQMMANFDGGGAAINVICKAVNASLKVIDVGVNADLKDFRSIAHEKVNTGTNDISQTQAMTKTEYSQAMAIGAKYAESTCNEGFRTIALGEMGIGNTSSAAALICAITGHKTEDIVGTGTGINEQALILKRAVVDKALKRHQNSISNPETMLQSLGGYEIVAIVGAILKAAALNRIVIVDGFISTAGALAACAINPGVRENLIFSHQSAETGHKLALAYLNAKPLLTLGLRLGEGTGAALSIPTLHCAATVLAEMATFEQAGVSTKTKHSDKS